MNKDTSNTEDFLIRELDALFDTCPKEELPWPWIWRAKFDKQGELVGWFRVEDYSPVCYV